ncbi:MAG: uroporphyrinogen decarboxylase family protein [Candidatus Bipolaricaulota bacterium]
MEPRERVLTSLHHEEPNRVPRDIGSLPVTGIHAEAYSKYLKEYKDGELDPNQVEIEDVIQQLARVDDRILEEWKVDTRGVWANPGSDWELGVDEDQSHYRFIDEWGITWGMPKRSGYYYDIRDNPLSGEIEREDILDYPWPDPADTYRVAGIAERVDRINAERRYFISMTGLGPGIYELSQWMRGYKDLWIDFLKRGKLAHAMMRKITDLKLEFWEMALSEVGHLVDTVYMADDIGNQNNLQISLETYKEFIKPYQTEVFHFIKDNSPGEICLFYHSDGAIAGAIPDLLEAGIEALNPVQVSAAGMDPGRLNAEFGDRLTFWGAGANPHGTLRNGSLTELDEEIKSRNDIFAPGGGWVFAPIHNLQPDVTPEKIQTIIEAMDKYGGY